MDTMSNQIESVRLYLDPVQGGTRRFYPRAPANTQQVLVTDNLTAGSQVLVDLYWIENDDGSKGLIVDMTRYPGKNLYIELYT